MTKKISIIVFLTILIITPAILFSASVPLVIMKSGEVKVSADGKEWKDVSIKNKIKINSILKTGKDSHAVLSHNKAIIKIKANSKIKLLSLTDNKKKKSGTKLKLFFGNVLSKITKLKRNQSFKIETPTAVAGVRGTEFSVLYKKGETTVKVFDGAVKLQSLKKKSLSIMLRKNEIGHFIKGKMKRLKTKLKSGEIKKVKGELNKMIKSKGLNKRIKSIKNIRRKR